jgi:hypothetical protein
MYPFGQEAVTLTKDVIDCLIEVVIWGGQVPSRRYDLENAMGKLYGHLRNRKILTPPPP